MLGSRNTCFPCSHSWVQTNESLVGPRCCCIVMAMPVLTLLKERARIQLSEDNAQLIHRFAGCLEAEGVTSAKQLVSLFDSDSAEQILFSAFPDTVRFEGEVVKYLEEFVAVLPQKSTMEERLTKRARNAQLDDVLHILNQKQPGKETADENEASADLGRVTRRALKARCTWSQGPSSGSLAEADQKEYDRWVRRALQLLEQAGAPAYLEAQRSADPQATTRALLGASRAATIRTRTRTWSGFLRWLHWHRGSQWPKDVVDLIDYVAEVMKDEPTATFPRAFAAAAGWFESRSGFSTNRRFSNHELFRRIIERANVEAEEALEEITRAPRFPISLIVALETAVIDEDSMPAGLRVVAWCRLLKVYGVMRMDDLKRMRPANVTLGEGGLQGKLLRTKCSGPGKKVRELNVYIPVAATISGASWLETGFTLWTEMVPQDFDFSPPGCPST